MTAATNNDSDEDETAHPARTMHVMDDRINAFWTWFANHADAIRATFARALAAKDYPALQALVEQVGAELHLLDRGLGVRLSGKDDTCTLIVQPLHAESRPLVTTLLACAPALPGWSFREQADSAPANIIVQDQTGKQLVIAFKDVRFRILPPKPDGSISVIFALPTEFDPRGDEGHLYQAAATEILKGAFGGTPSGMGSYAMVPASWIEGETRPVSELADAWAGR